VGPAGASASVGGGTAYLGTYDLAALLTRAPSFLRARPRPHGTRERTAAISTSSTMWCRGGRCRGRSCHATSAQACAVQWVAQGGRSAHLLCSGSFGASGLCELVHVGKCFSHADPADGAEGAAVAALRSTLLSRGVAVGTQVRLPGARLARPLVACIALCMGAARLVSLTAMLRRCPGIPPCWGTNTVQHPVQMAPHATSGGCARGNARCLQVRLRCPAIPTDHTV
jgi:hypothetical protein